MTAPAITWQLTADYFETCNCDVVCPCLFSAGPPLTANPTQGDCDAFVAFHIESGEFGGTKLDGLNVAFALRTPGPMGAGNGEMALYLDERASGPQRQALEAIFRGAAGGPMGALAPLAPKYHGASFLRIEYSREGERRSLTIPGIASMGAEPIDTAAGGVAWVSGASPIAPESVALARAVGGSTYTDHGLRWDNSGKNAHFAPIKWSNA